MAGGHGGFQPVKIDPAIERWNHMRENVYRTFKFTPKAARQVTIWAGIVPALTAYALWSADASLDWSGKLRGQSLYSKAPAVAAVAPAEEE